MRTLYGHYRAEEMKHFPYTEEQKNAFLDQQFEAQTIHYGQNYPGAERSIVEEDGEAVGRFFVHRRETEIRIMDVALLPGAQNRGIGTRLIGAILEEGRATGRVVSVHVEAFNPALRLYERLGFRRVAINGVYFLMEWNGGG